MELAELENRILYSASPMLAEMLGGADGVWDEPLSDQWPASFVTDERASSDRQVTPVLDQSDSPSVQTLLTEASATDDRSASSDDASLTSADSNYGTETADAIVDFEGDQLVISPKELVFVDTSVPEYEKLLSNLLEEPEDPRFVEVVLLDGGRDGIEQITEELAGHEELDAVHIVSHGAAGQVKLGNAWLSIGNAEGYAGDLARWGNVLTDGADLLLYGCDLAESENGQALIEAVSLLTGADVAASVDATGHDSLGGDWNLEFATGPIETSIAFSHQLHDDWRGLLAGSIVIVDTNADTADGDTTSIASLLADKGADGLISLREAIVAANNSPNSGGVDEIHFDIGGGGTQTIQPLAALPTITDPVLIDGTTQLGYSGSPLIELDGSSTVGVDGILITAGNSTIRGLVINRFDGDGIHVSGAGGNVIQGNHIGTNFSGTTALPNGGDGIEITTANNTIGGASPGAHNVISGNSQNGIWINGIGATGNTIQGNYIGTDASGSLVLGNASAGIRITNGSGNMVGGTVGGAGNTIANNQDAGVAVEQGIQNAIRGNAIYDNVGAGIDLGADGVTANDAGDGDTGGNELQNYPSLDAAIVTASEIAIGGTINSTPNTTLELDFYASTVGDPSGHGEGEFYVGSKSVTTDGAGNASFLATFTGVTTSAGDEISATATDPLGNTSEFAQNVAATLDDPTIPDAALAPEIDGNVDDIWSVSPLHVIRNVTIGDVSGASDLSGSWKGLYDPDYLYLLVDVTDDMLVDDSGPADPWMDDMVEVFIDADFSQQTSYDGVNDFHFGFPWNDTTVYTGPNSVADTTGITFQIVATATGYRLEAAIPWATLGVFPVSGDAIGFDVQIADDDDGGVRDGKLAWYATSEISYQNPSAFARVEMSSPRDGSLWLSTGGDVASPSGVSTLDSWESGDALQFSTPQLEFEPGTTNGTLSVMAALDALADDGEVNIDALHYVTRDITIGGAASIDLIEGDLLLSTADDEGFTSINSLSVADEDLFLFRPDTPGVYTSGTFTPVLDDLSSLLGIDELSSISLVERDTVLDDTTLTAGDFLFTRPGVDEANDIFVFHTVDVGQGTTDGSESLLIEGDDIGIGQNLVGLELIEQSVEIGGHIFESGQILSTLENDGNVGDNSIPVKYTDIFALDITATTFASGIAAADAAIALEGSDLGLDSLEESPDALSLIHLGNSPSADIGGPYAINEGDSLALDASGSSDPDGDPLYYAWDLDNDGVYDDVTGETPTVAWSELQSHGIVDDGTYTIAVLVRDGTGGVDWTTTTLTVSDTPPTLITTGDTVYKVGRAYTLDLSVIDPGDDTITGWTINWGDGTIETLAGNPATATHTYAQAGFTYNTLASATNEEGTFLQNQLLVPSEVQDSIFRFAATTGDYLEEFATGDGLNQPYEAIVGSDGNLYVSGDAGNHVLRYDPVTGAFVDEFIAAGSGGLQNAKGLSFGPDGNLYVSSDGTDEVLRFDGSTGAFIDAFVPAAAGGLDGPSDLVFGPDGNLYVASSLGDSILRFNGITGAFIDEFVAGGSGGLDNPSGITFGPDGHLYVANSNGDNVLRYDGGTGVFLNEFVAAGSGGLSQPTGIEFGPDGNLFVSSRDSDAVIRFNGTTGLLIDQFVPTGSGGLQAPAIPEFLPGHQVAIVINRPPVADAGGPYSINEAASVTLDASGSADPDNDPLAYSWDIDNDGTYGDVTGESPAVTWAQLASFGITDDGTYTISVQVDDGDGGIDTHSTTITVNNIAPTGNDDVGGAFTTDEDTPFTTGNVLTNDNDVNPVDILSVIGIDTSGTVGAVIDNGDGTFDYDPNGQFESLSATQQANDTFTYTVSDDDGGSNTATVTMTIDGANDAPTVDDATFGTTENAADGTAVGTVSASDIDMGDTLAYSITGGNTGGAFAIDNVTGEITVANGLVLDFETIPVFTLTIEVQDTGGLTDTASVTVNLSDVNEAPTAGDSSFGLDENSISGTNVGTVSASDPDAGDTLDYTITGGNTGGAFAIDNATGLITVADSSALDFEATPTFVLDVEVQDMGGLADTASVTVNLSDVNEVPTANNASFGIDENSSNGTALGTVSASDPDAGDTLDYTITGGNTGGAFAIDNATGLITVASSSALDYEATPTFILTVEAQDTGGLTDTASVTINLNDVNETPWVNDGAFIISENAANGTGVGTLSAADPDVGDVLTYAITGGNAGGAFAIDNMTGEITVADGSVLDFETAAPFDLTIEVQDSGGLLDTASAAIQLADINERPTGNGIAADLLENSANGTVVGTVTAVDPDAGDLLSFSITGGNTAGAFAIDSVTGEISVANSSALDGDTTPTFDLMVEVRDTMGLTDDVLASINLLNVNEAPVATDATLAVVENSANGTAVGAVSASDPDAGDALTYTITSGNTDGAFAIDSGTGVITVADADTFDIELMPTFVLTVEVQDVGGLMDTASVTINLLEEQELPVGNDDYLRQADSRHDGTQGPPETGDSLPSDFAFQQTTGYAQNGSTIGAPAVQTSTMQGDLEQASRDPATESLARDVPRRNEIEHSPIPFTDYVHASSEETTPEVKGGEPTLEQKSANANHEQDGRTSDHGEQRATDDRDSADLAAYDAGRMRRALEANLVAVAGISTCYLLSKIPNGSKPTAAKSKAGPEMTGTPAKCDDAVDETDTAASIGTASNENVPEDENALNNAPTAETQVGSAKSSRPTNCFSARPVGREDLTHPAETPADPSTVVAEPDRHNPPNECSIESDKPEGEPEAEAGRPSGEKSTSTASRLLAGVGALSRKLRGRFSHKADSTDATPDDDELAEERRLDRFL